MSWTTVTRPVSLALLLLPLTAGCGGDEAPKGGSESLGSLDAPLNEGEVEDIILREQAIAAYSIDDWGKAFEVLLPLVQREDPAAGDLIRIAQVLTELGRIDQAREEFERARLLTPDDIRVVWGLFELAYEDGYYEKALVHAKRVVELAPDDYPSQLALANTYTNLERYDEARPLYKDLIEREFEGGASWYLSTVHRYYWNLVYSDREEEAEPWMDEFMKLKDADITAPSPAQMRRGSFGELAAPKPGEMIVDDALRMKLLGDGGEPTQFVPDDSISTPGLKGLFVVSLQDADLGDLDKEAAYTVEEPVLEVVYYGDGGLNIARRSTSGTWDIEQLIADPVSIAVPFDVDALDLKGGSLRDAQLDLVAVTERGIVLIRQTFDIDDGISWQEWDTPLLGPDFPVADLCPLDFDHEGDLDLLVVGPMGVRLLRNDGVPAEGGVFVDVAAEAGLPTSGDFSWCTIEDFDIDNDVDLLFGGAAGVFHGRNERGGFFSDISGTLPEVLSSKPAFVDVDRDGRGDMVVGGADSLRVLANRFGERWEELGTLVMDVSLETSAAPLLSDLGDVDQLRALRAGSTALMAFDLRPIALGAGVSDLAKQPQYVALGDVSGDGVDDLLVSDGESFTALIAQADDHSVRLELLGTKDNRRGVGAIVELRAGPMYQRWYWDGRPRSIAVGIAERLDVVRVTWPNGIVQTVNNFEAPGSYVIKQREGLIGSCPFLYTWNGTTFEFISDVLGITPLGLPIDEGKLVPPDHDEYVLVRGDQLAPRDGFFEMQFTEELREVTYLDFIRLDVIDHPADVEIQPNERFTFPPFPEAHTHTIKDALTPITAVDQGGQDWTEELRTKDEVFARGFEPLRGQFLGLADMHHLELSFDAESLRTASKLRLLMTGWLYWTDASVNMASARHPKMAFVPPLLWVPNEAGEWVQVGPPLGFPAGKLKTMVVDVTPFLNRNDPRLRVSSSLALYWDAIRLAVDDDDAPLVVTSIAPASAELWERGFSEPLPLHGEAGLDWFEWDTLATQPRWNQHPGLYTRFGETLPLLEESDDQFIIMGTGDALKVRFSAANLPPLAEGWTRDYLVYLDGWAKDRDPNTKAALYVEPLPFHGMSGYPYGPDEAFPDTPESKAWRREWNTRPAKLWIEPLARSGQ